ncbi:hypothetical protein C3L33_04378, partial [Rhododendron williamsianum]
MDYCHSNINPFFVNNYAVKSSALGLRRLVFSDNQKPRQVPSSVYFSGHRRPLVAVARAGASSNCEFSSLNTPLEPKSAPGKYLSGLLLSDDTEEFQDAVCKQLEQCSDNAFSVGACARRKMELCHQRDWKGEAEGCLQERRGQLGSWEASQSEPKGNTKQLLSAWLEAREAAEEVPLLLLRRRIAELREQECQIAVEDIMYVLVLYKFHEIKVHLVPRLSKCIYNHRLELWPSNDWELESIHSFEVLELIREHLTGVIGWKADSNVVDNWATTEIPLCSLRHRLELNLGLTCQNPLLVPELLSCGMKNIAFGRIGRAQSTSLGPESCIRVKKRENLKCYVMGFDPETLEMCAKPKTREAVSLVEKHSCALFGDENTGLIETNDVIVTSLSSLKRMVLEAVAFGSFLWDTEEYVDAVYKLKED